jgi:N utilization substance protein B
MTTTITRRLAREWAVQMLTAIDLNRASDIENVIADFWEQLPTLDADDGGLEGARVKARMREFASERVLGVMENVTEIDSQIAPLMEHWDISRLGTVERAVLRLGAWELKNTDIPCGVVINEAVDLVNWFSSPRSRALINGVLDKYAKKIR